ncbi:hypothetical protein [Salinactinospora qingdaonensis]|uniref:Uncharacterized protein n=1 Tax=Salinactinospora qingdaonensis TaxID=702744 RepID=A0ABP7F6N2_9ACTN
MPDHTPRPEQLPPLLRPLAQRLDSGLLPSARKLASPDPSPTELTWRYLRRRLHRLWSAAPDTPDEADPSAPEALDGGDGAPGTEGPDGAPASDDATPPRTERPAAVETAEAVGTVETDGAAESPAAIEADRATESPAAVEAAIEEFRRYLATPDERVRRELRTLVLYPHELLRHSVKVGGVSDERDHWVRACRVVEAVWRHVDSAPDTHGDLGRLRPIAARNRFLVLTEPMRYRSRALTPRLPFPRGGLAPRLPVPRSGRAWLPTPLDAPHGDTYGVFNRAFGHQTHALLLSRARAARRDWYTCLDTYQAQPLLAQAPSAALETEVAAVATARGYRSGPLVISVNDLNLSARPDGEDEAITWGLVQRHLLPRFTFLPTVVLRDTPLLGLDHLLAALALACGISAPAALALGAPFSTAALLAAGCYALIGAGALVFGRIWTAPWLLRLPATAALGLVVLIPLPDWWQRASLDLPFPEPTQVAPLLLFVGVSLGYLLIEARNHGAGRLSAPVRAVTVVAAGALHAFLVSLLGLVVIAPAFGEHTNGTGIDAVWNGATGDPAAVLALATAWCLTVGVFSQVLWDDRPITAPLAHLHWRNDR